MCLNFNFFHNCLSIAISLTSFSTSVNDQGLVPLDQAFIIAIGEKITVCILRCHSLMVLEPRTSDVNSMQQNPLYIRGVIKSSKLKNRKLKKSKLFVW